MSREDAPDNPTVSLGESLSGPVGESMDRTIPGTPQDADFGADTGERVLVSGATVGRYSVLSLLGTGGMGQVYAAYDPQLDRRIALKLLHVGREREDGSEGRTRLLREAQAIARISHPNVITVHDVGTHDGRVFVAMEFIEGQTLGSWLHGRARAWRPILDVFIRAGRGLAAAHVQGLVHRDFKPDNVMMGDDGRVAVVDFGLARATSHQESVDVVTTSGGSSLSEDLTMTGTIMGTPAYMAPEQFRGLEVDSRSDQFAFCVALYEALFGRRPFQGSTLQQLRNSVLGNALQPPPRGSEVPGRIYEAIARGLSLRPSDRHPSMAALLRVLRRRGRSRARTVFGATALVVATAGVTWASTRVVGDTKAPCHDGALALGETWTIARRDAVERSLAAIPKPYADKLAAAAVAGLDEYAQAWVSSHEAACRATRIEGTHSEEILHLRMACLADKRRHMEALVDLLADADADLVDRSLEAVDALPPSSDCEDAQRLKAQVAPPPDPAVAATVAELRERLAVVRAQESAGQYVKATPDARELVEASAEVGYQPLVAETSMALGSILAELGEFDEAERVLVTALTAAYESGDDRLFAGTLSRLIWVRREEPLRADDVDRWFRLALASIRRLGGDPVREAAVYSNYGNSLRYRGEYERALEMMEHVLELRSANSAPDSQALASAWLNLGTIQMKRGDWVGAGDSFTRSRDVTIATKGPGHPDSLTATNNLALVYYRRDDVERAEALYKKVVVGRRRLGDTAGTANALQNLGAVQIERRDLDEAKATFLRVLELRKPNLEARDEAPVLANLAMVHVLDDEPAAALEFADRALVLFEQELGAEHPNLVLTSKIRAFALRRLRRYDDAAAQLEAAYELGLRKLGEDHPLTNNVRAEMGRVALDGGRAAEAVVLLERALEVAAMPGRSDTDRAEIRLALGHALWKTGGDRARARRLVREARDYLRATGRRKRSSGEATRWLTEHPLPP